MLSDNHQWLIRNTSFFLEGFSCLSRRYGPIHWPVCALVHCVCFSCLSWFHKTALIITYCLGFSIDLSALNHFDNSFSNWLEHVFNFVATLSWCFVIGKSVWGCEFLSLFRTDLSTILLSSLLLFHVEFISNNNRLYLFMRVVLDFE